MTIANHDLGQTSVAELSAAEARDLFACRCEQELGVSPEDFLAAHETGEFPEEWDIAAISRVEFLLPYAK